MFTVGVPCVTRSLRGRGPQADQGEGAVRVAVGGPLLGWQPVASWLHGLDGTNVQQLVAQSR